MFIHNYSASNIKLDRAILILGFATVGGYLWAVTTDESKVRRPVPKVKLVAEREQLGIFDHYKGKLTCDVGSIDLVTQIQPPSPEFKPFWDKNSRERVEISRNDGWNFGPVELTFTAITDNDLSPPEQRTHALCARFVVGTIIDLAITEPSDSRTLAANGYQTSRSNPTQGDVKHDSTKGGLVLFPNNPANVPVWFGFNDFHKICSNLDYTVEFALLSDPQESGGAQFVFPDGYALQVSEGLEYQKLTLRHDSQYADSSGQERYKKPGPSNSYPIPVLERNTKHVLHVERTKTEMKVWIDNKLIGTFTTDPKLDGEGKYIFRSYKASVLISKVSLFRKEDLEWLTSQPRG